MVRKSQKRTEVSAAVNAAFKPEFIRLPKPGTAEPYSGLKRSKLNELILPSEINGFKPPVRSVCLRNHGQTKGVRLIMFDSLMEYLRGLETQNPDAA
jgi:hypothetical protein